MFGPASVLQQDPESKRLNVLVLGVQLLLQDVHVAFDLIHLWLNSSGSSVTVKNF